MSNFYSSDPSSSTALILQDEIKLKSHEECITHLILSFNTMHKSIADPNSTLSDRLSHEAVFTEEFEKALKSINFPTTLHKLILVIIAIDWKCKRFAGDKPSASQKEEALLTARLTVRIFRKVFEVIVNDTKRLNSLTMCIVSAVEQRISSTLLSLLPAIRTISSWLIVNEKSLSTACCQHHHMGHSIKKAIENMWIEYAKMISCFGSLFTAQELPQRLSYIYAEDIACRGFRPFEAEQLLAPRFLIEWSASKYQKSDCINVERSPPLKEALCKVGDLMRDAICLSEEDTVPIDLKPNREGRVGLLYQYHQTHQSCSCSCITNSNDVTHGPNVGPSNDASMEQDVAPDFYLPVLCPAYQDGSEKQLGHQTFESRHSLSAEQQLRDVHPEKGIWGVLTHIVSVATNTLTLNPLGDGPQ